MPFYAVFLTLLRPRLHWSWASNANNMRRLADFGFGMVLDFERILAILHL